MPRGRPPAIEPSSSINMHISESLRTRIDLQLYSEVERRVPKGAYQRFFSHLAHLFFDTRELDLAPFLGSLPGEHLVRARPETLERLRAHLTQAKP